MYLKKFAKIFTILSITLMEFVVLPSGVFAGELSINPSSKTVANGDEFVVEVLIDSQGDDLIEATATIVFDPTVLQLVKAERNASLFATFPVGEQTTDNDNGVVMITGFTQSGTSALYNTLGDPDILAQYTFKAIDKGTTKLEWVYSGTNEAFQSVLMKDASPTQNVLLSQPSSATITINDGNTTTPSTGIFDNSGLSIAASLLVAGVLLTIGTYMVYQGKPHLINSKGNTIVVVEK